MEDAIGQKRKLIEKHLGTLLLAIVISASALAWGWTHVITNREDRLDRREERLDKRESEVRTNEEAMGKVAFENEKKGYTLEQERAALTEAQRMLSEREATLKNHQSALTLQHAAIGIDAQEAVLRDEARRLIDDYTKLMGNTDLHRDHCARQAAQDAGRPMLSRIRTIGERLRNGADLVNFASRQNGIGTMSTDCENTVSQAATKTPAHNATQR